MTQLRQLDDHFKRVLPWVDVAEDTWDRAAHLWAESRRRGRPREDDGDLLIAAQALALNAVVVTRNVRDFVDLQVPVVDWEVQK
jgi:predicted nucleic acid-binding protein